MPAMLLEKATALQHIAVSLDDDRDQQHPGLVRFHGCRVRRGRITGLVLDGYDDNLREFLKQGNVINDKPRFMAALDAAARYPHTVGLAHNDINPGNVMIKRVGSSSSVGPVLVDFGSCHKIGDRLTASRGTPGWTVDGDDCTTSKWSHDLSGLGKIRSWLDKPVFR